MCTSQSSPISIPFPPDPLYSAHNGTTACCSHVARFFHPDRHLTPLVFQLFHVFPFSCFGSTSEYYGIVTYSIISIYSVPNFFLQLLQQVHHSICIVHCDCDTITMQLAAAGVHLEMAMEDSPHIARVFPHTSHSQPGQFRDMSFADFDAFAK